MLEWRLNRSFRYLVYPQWEATGLRHGFIGASSNFRDAVLVENSRYFCRDFNTDRLVVLNQVHGNDIVRLPESGAEADGIIVPLETASAGAYAIRTADCLAVFIRSRGGFVMVHAGLRPESLKTRSGFLMIRSWRYCVGLVLVASRTKLAQKLSRRLAIAPCFIASEIKSF